jgi:hypothetical protein
MKNICPVDQPHDERETMMKRAKTPNEILKNHPMPPRSKPSPLVRTGGIRSKPGTVAPSKRIGGARGPSA